MNAEFPPAVPPSGGKSRKPRRPAAGLSAEPARKRNPTVSLSPQTHLRLSVHALHLGISPCQLVDQLINQHLRRFAVQDRGGSRWSRADGQADLAGATLPVGETLTPGPADPEPLEPGAGEGTDAPPETAEAATPPRRRRAG